MEEANSSLVFIEKNTDNEDISIIDDYEILNSIYPDEIKEIKNNKDSLYFLLNHMFQDVPLLFLLVYHI